MLLEHLEESNEKYDERKFKLRKEEREYFVESFKKMQELKLSK